MTKDLTLLLHSLRSYPRLSILLPGPPTQKKQKQGIYLPTGLLRHAVSKVMLDVTSLPSLGQLVRAMMSIGLFGGDASKW